jgi:Ca2+-binding EF-hand superfamily protein
MDMKALVVAVVISVLAVGASAHEGMHGPGSDYDADQSGALSIDEYKLYLKDSKQDVAKAAAQFAALDKNKDGMLSSAEFASGQKPKQK